MVVVVVMGTGTVVHWCREEPGKNQGRTRAYCTLPAAVLALSKNKVRNVPYLVYF